MYAMTLIETAGSNVQQHGLTSHVNRRRVEPSAAAKPGSAPHVKASLKVLNSTF